MKPFFKYLFILLAWSPSIASAHYIINGKVLNKENQQPLPHASIQIKGSSTGTTTDESGNFQIVTNEKEGTFIVSYVGFETREVHFNADEPFLIIYLQKKPIDLETVKINSYTIMPLQTVAKIDLNIKSVNSSQDLLRTVPGLFIAQHAGGGKAEQIFLRGFDSDHGTDIDVTVDDIPVNMVSQAHGQGYADLHWVIPELIYELDFGKGPYYADHGDFATSGYVNFKTKKYLDQSMIKAEGGMFNTFRTVALLNLLSHRMRSKGQSAYIGLEYFLTDGPFDNPQNFYRLNLWGRYNSIIDQQNTITVSFTLFRSNWDQSGQIPVSAIKEGLINRWGSIDPTEGGSTSRDNIYLNYIHQFEDHSVISNLVYYTNYSFDLYSNFTFFLEDTIHGDQIKQKEKRNLLGYKGKYIKSWGLKDNSNLELTCGGGLRYDYIVNSQLLHTEKRYTIIDTANIGDINESNVNLYGQLNWEKKKWLLNFGLRVDGFKFDYTDKTTGFMNNQTEYKYTVSPKINIAFNLSRNVQLYTKLGKGFHSNDARVVVATDSLKTLPAIYGVDVGTILKPHPKVIINTALWYSYLEEELVWSGDAGTWEPSGKTRRYGIDAGMRWQIERWLFFDFNLNLCNARFIDEPDGSNYLPLSPLFTSTGGITLKNLAGWNASLRYRYMGENPADETKSVTTQSYFVCDLMVSYTLKTWTISATVDNLFNTDWNEAQFANHYRVAPDYPAQYGLTFTPGVPFYFRLGLKKVF